MNISGEDRTKMLLLAMLDAVLRSWWTVVVGLCVGLAGGLVVLEQSDKVYKAFTVVDIDVEALPDYFVTETVLEEDSARLNNVMQRVLQSDELAERIGPLASLSKDGRSAEELVGQARGRTKLWFMDINRPVEIHFFDSEPVIVAEVANAITHLFVEMTAEVRSGTARETVETMERFAEEARQVLLEQQSEISAYRARHFQELPERADEIEAELDRVRTDLAANIDAQEGVETRIQTVQAQASAAATTPTSPGDGRTPDASAQAPGVSELEALYAERRELLKKWRPTHPLVENVQSRIDELERLTPQERSAAEATSGRRSAEQTGPTVSGRAASIEDLGLGVWDMRLKAEQARLRQLETEETLIRQKMARLESRLANIPDVQRKLDELSFGLRSKEQAVENAEARVLTAKSGELMETLEGEKRFAINSLASVPTTPESPNPPMLLGGGAVFGLILFVGPLLARRYLAPKIRSENEIRALVDVPVLARIPSMPTDGARRRKRLEVLTNVGLSCSGVAVLAVVLALRQVGVL